MDRKIGLYLSGGFGILGIISLIYSLANGHWLGVAFSAFIIAMSAYRLYPEFNYKRLEKKNNIDWKEQGR